MAAPIASQNFSTVTALDEALADGDSLLTLNVSKTTTQKPQISPMTAVVTYLVTKLFAKLDTAQEYTKTQNFNATSLTSSSAHIAWDASSNQVAKHTATENTTLDNPTNMVDGATYIFIFTQHASSAKTLAFGNAYKWPYGVAPTVSTGASAVDILTFVSDGTNMYGTYQQAFA